jgi:menaquinone-dependent protoporphyrinogen oxidase
MKVLVTVASKHGATAEIVRAIGNKLLTLGFEVDVVPADDVESVRPYDAVVLGSGVYAGHWLEPAKALAKREATALAARPVWLFSSGPLGDPAKPAGDPAEVPALLATTHAIQHRVFAGMIDRRDLGFAERAILAVVKAPLGDFRPWDSVAEWAAQIARTLQAKSVPETAR